MLIESIVQPISYCLGPNDSLSTVATLLEAEGITALPVADDDGNVLGLITAKDVKAAIADTSDRAEACAISELVRPGGLTCTVSAEVASLTNQARFQHHTHVLVFDKRGSVLGIADLSPYQRSSQEDEHREDALDEALKATFPASDPISLP